MTLADEIRERVLARIDAMSDEELAEFFDVTEWLALQLNPPAGYAVRAQGPVTLAEWAAFERGERGMRSHPAGREVWIAWADRLGLDLHLAPPPMSAEHAAMLAAIDAADEFD